MSKILIINAGKTFAHSKGALNISLTEVADSFLRDAGHDVRVTNIEQGYDVADEVQSYLWADAIIYQMPGWWMGAPWTLKNTSMKSSPKATATCTKAMAVAALTPRKNTVPVA